jgi:hypothetical protein
MLVQKDVNIESRENRELREPRESGLRFVYFGWFVVKKIL